LPTENTRAELPAPGLEIEFLERFVVVPGGSPVAVRFTELLKPRTIAVVIIALPFPSLAIRMEAGVVTTVKSGAVCASPKPTATVTEIMAVTAILKVKNLQPSRRPEPRTIRVVICAS
jgi:hypothetical protein